MGLQRTHIAGRYVRFRTAEFLSSRVMQSGRTALVFGATGLVGSYVTALLCADERYSKVLVFSRREVEPVCAKAEMVVTDFDKLTEIADQVRGHDLFMCLGTTLRKAGSKEAQRHIDQELPLHIAAIASRNGVANYLFVSSLGADAGSGNFYLRLKGETEQVLHQYPFVKRVLLRPSMLLGKRHESRLGESIGKVIVRLLTPLLIGPFRRYRGIHGKAVAKAMIAIANSPDIKSVYESEEIMEVARATSKG